MEIPHWAKVLARSLAVPTGFTGQITVKLNFHLGQFKTASVAREESFRDE